VRDEGLPARAVVEHEQLMRRLGPAQIREHVRRAGGGRQVRVRGGRFAEPARHPPVARVEEIHVLEDDGLVRIERFAQRGDGLRSSGWPLPSSPGARDTRRDHDRRDERRLRGHQPRHQDRRTLRLRLPQPRQPPPARPCCHHPPRPRPPHDSNQRAPQPTPKELKYLTLMLSKPTSPKIPRAASPQIVGSNDAQRPRTMRSFPTRRPCSQIEAADAQAHHDGRIGPFSDR
jgi:hypothetical protein